MVKLVSTVNSLQTLHKNPNYAIYSFLTSKHCNQLCRMPSIFMALHCLQVPTIEVDACRAAKYLQRWASPIYIAITKHVGCPCTPSFSGEGLPKKLKVVLCICDGPQEVPCPANKLRYRVNRYGLQINNSQMPACRLQSLIYVSN